MLPGFNEYLTPRNLLFEEAGWAMDILKNRGAYNNALILDHFIRKHGEASHVVEYGCGTGWLPWLIREVFHGPFIGKWTGIDLNPLCIEVAKHKNPDHEWLHHDVLQYKGRGDIVCCFAMLKHIDLDVWPIYFSHILNTAPVAVINIAFTYDKPKDTGVDYVHSWIDTPRALHELDIVGKKVIEFIPNGAVDGVGYEQTWVCVDADSQ